MKYNVVSRLISKRLYLALSHHHQQQRLTNLAADAVDFVRVVPAFAVGPTAVAEAVSAVLSLMTKVKDKRGKPTANRKKRQPAKVQQTKQKDQEGA